MREAFHLAELSWIDLETSNSELRLDNTLNMGQCFNWEKIQEEPGECWIGMIKNTPVVLRQMENTVEFCSLASSEKKHVASLKHSIHDYFQLDHNLKDLYEEWSYGCDRLKSIAPFLIGTRVVRQEPWECLISFICSSNNNIARITSMLRKLRSSFGVPRCSLKLVSDTQDSLISAVHAKPKWRLIYNSESVVDRDSILTGVKYESSLLADVKSYDIYEFPAPEVIAQVAETELQKLGMGYRAKFIIETAKLVQSKAGGWEKWFEYLRGLAVSDDTPVECIVTAGKSSSNGSKKNAASTASQSTGHTAVASCLASHSTVDKDKTRHLVQSLLRELPGVGPKVADCVALFSLDQSSVIPVDTHVWSIAVRDYCTTASTAAAAVVDDATSACTPSLPSDQSVSRKAANTHISSQSAQTRRLLESSNVSSSVSYSPGGIAASMRSLQPVDTTATVTDSMRSPTDKPIEFHISTNIATASLTPKIYEAVGELFRRRFGSKAGWAHSLLFAAELSWHKSKLPQHIRNDMDTFAAIQKESSKLAKEAAKLRKADKKHNAFDIISSETGPTTKKQKVHR
jgi:N-glycosylase/DNA lyase